VPHAYERLIETQTTNLVDVLPETLPPARQRFRVMAGEILKMKEPEVRVSPERMTQG
jgi:hypothetical protein